MSHVLVTAFMKKHGGLQIVKKGSNKDFCIHFKALHKNKQVSKQYTKRELKFFQFFIIHVLKNILILY